MSRTFSMSKGSGDSLKVSVRCGCKPNARQMRLMVIRLSPVALAKPRVLQCVSPRGVLSKVRIHLLDLGIAYLAGCSGSGLVVESFPASFQKSGAPLAHHAQRGPHFPRHRLVVESFGAGQHHARTPRQQGLAARPMGQRLEPLAFLFGQNQSFVWVARSTSGTSLSLPRPAADLDV